MHFVIGTSAALLAAVTTVGAQQIQFEPTNKAPNPYQTVEGWAKLPEGRTWGSFSPDGKLLMTLGRAGGRGEPGYFWQPNDVLVAKNGDIFVAEGHASNDSANARILKFDKKGKFLKAWGHKGSGPGAMDQPHALA